MSILFNTFFLDLHLEIDIPERNDKLYRLNTGDNVYFCRNTHNQVGSITKLLKRDLYGFI